MIREKNKKGSKRILSIHCWVLLSLESLSASICSLKRLFILLQQCPYPTLTKPFHTLFSNQFKRVNNPITIIIISDHQKLKLQSLHSTIKQKANLKRREIMGSSEKTLKRLYLTNQIRNAKTRKLQRSKTLERELEKKESKKKRFLGFFLLWIKSGVEENGSCREKRVHTKNGAKQWNIKVGFYSKRR